MSKSNEHLYRCLDIMNADKNISEETRIIMFVEYAKLVSEESKSSEWYSVKQFKPSVSKQYEVYRAGARKQHYEMWNGTGWAYNNNDITHFREIKAPNLFDFKNR